MAWRQQGIRRYGFHGISHHHMARSLAAATANQDLRLVSLHLGGGCSACAIRGLRCQDTSMGFTPLEGLIMGSRCGSVDPAILLHQLRHGWDLDSLEAVLQHQSGLAGLSGISEDMRQVRQAAAQGHAQARLALDVFFTALIRAVGSAVAVLQGVDVVALTGGIGEHDQALQQALLAHLHWLGVRPASQPPPDWRPLLAAEWRRPGGSVGGASGRGRGRCPGGGQAAGGPAPRPQIPGQPDGLRRRAQLHLAMGRRGCWVPAIRTGAIAKCFPCFPGRGGTGHFFKQFSFPGHIGCPYPVLPACLPACWPQPRPAWAQSHPCPSAPLPGPGIELYVMFDADVALVTDHLVQIGSTFVSTSSGLTTREEF